MILTCRGGSRLQCLDPCPKWVLQCCCITQVSCSNAVSKTEQCGMRVAALADGVVSMSQQAGMYVLLLLMVDTYVSMYV